MSILKRLFRIGRAEAHAAIDKLENPEKMLDEGIRELKEKLQQSIEALAQVKALAIRTKKEAQNLKSKADEYEFKAMQLLKRAQSGAIDPAEADRLATELLAERERILQHYQTTMKNYESYNAQVMKLEASVKDLKNQIKRWEQEAKMLKARAKVSEATKNVNKQLSAIDASSTLAMLERMKEKVEANEALAESYGELASEAKSVDEEVDKLLGGADVSGAKALEELKKKMGMLPSGDDDKKELPQ